MKKLREIAGYVLGGLLFVLLIPAVMWFASGRPAIAHVSVLRTSLAVLMMFSGLAMSIWTIVYMRQRGKGNPMDAFGHEVAPRTQHLMTDGPYRINRNPMLTGTLLYLAGFVVLLWTWQSVLVWLLFLAIMMVQVISEEHRLHRDFGQEYDTYRRQTRRF
jgi:protein-S-isoprenylcysteine O-methyltransferase Ste14